MDQQGCAENDPNGPVFDPVHGVFHHFYQIHLAAPPGSGPDYGHFVSKNLIEWAALPVAIWNGLDASTGATMAFFRRADVPRTGRGDAVAATRLFRGRVRRRGCHVAIPRTGRTGRGDAVAATWLFRGRVVATPWLRR